MGGRRMILLEEMYTFRVLLVGILICSVLASLALMQIVRRIYPEGKYCSTDRLRYSL